MLVKVSNVDHVIRELRKLEEIGNEPLMRKAGEKAREIVKKRTARGVDMNGTSFIPYSPGYKKSGKPNLKVMGEMLGSIRVEAAKKEARVFTPSTPHAGGISNYDLMLVHNQGGKSGKGKGFKMPKREYFGIVMKKEIKQIRDVFYKVISRLVQRINQ